MNRLVLLSGNGARFRVCVEGDDGATFVVAHAADRKVDGFFGYFFAVPESLHEKNRDYFWEHYIRMFCTTSSTEEAAKLVAEGGLGFWIPTCAICRKREALESGLKIFCELPIESD